MTPALVMLIVRIGLIAALYGFLCVALWLIWKNLPARSPAGSADCVPGYRLSWMDPKTRRIRILPLEKDVILIGRAADADIRIADETVTFMHARLVCRDTRWLLEDLNSRNGTLVNGMLIAAQAVLAPGDTIQIGNCALEFAVLPNRQAAEVS